MKLLFLDIDGVLNSEQSCHRFYREYGRDYGGFNIDPDDIMTVMHENVLWDQQCVDNLKHIIDETQAFVVISSSWGHWFDIECFKLMFECYGWYDAPVVSKTPRKMDNSFRGNEIDWFLDEWQARTGMAQYVILDDDADFHNYQQPFLVHVDGRVGLTREDAHKAIDTLGF